MPYLDVYIGFSEGYSWKSNPKKANIGNIPQRKSPFFPEGSTAFRKLVEKISSGVLKGKRVDWGAFAAVVNKAQIIKFMDELYPSDWQEKDRAYIEQYGFPDEYGQLKDFVESLSDAEDFILVACEL